MSVHENLLLSIKEFCELNVKVTLKSGILTLQKLTITSNQVLFFFFESRFANTLLLPLPQYRRITNEMAGKEIKVSQGKVNKHK